MFSALSVSTLTLPSAAQMVTSVDLLQVMGAVSALVRSSPFSTSVTPVVPFFTVTEPLPHVPVSIYVPAPSIVSAVPSIA